MKSISTKVSTTVFNYIHQNNLVYNTCWEDPRCDRQLLDLKEDSDVVMITSAGCNALDYLLDKPANIHCVDMNSRQNALLDLKIASINNKSFSEHFSMFGDGKLKNAPDYYRQELRAKLPVYAQKYWDNNIDFFTGKGIRKSFYQHGTSGVVAYFMNVYLKAHRKLHKKIELLLNTNDISHQKEIYSEIEPKLMNNFMKWVMNRHLMMCMLGVPQAQQELFAKKYEHGVLGFIQQCLRKVFTEIPANDNYFWRVYIQGSYSKDCCPNYLQQNSFELLSSQTDKISLHTSTLSDFLVKNPGSYSHYVLLDHQDWLANFHPATLKEEWDLILKNSKKGTKILMRSASEQINFFPDFVKERLVFNSDLTAKTHLEDRVGTYASVYLAEVI